MIAKIQKSLALTCVAFVALSFHLSYPKSDTSRDSADLEELIYDLFEAIDSRDYRAFRRLCTEDFVLFEAGRIMNMDETIAFLRLFEGKGRMTRTFSDMKIHRDGTAAWMYLRHRASGIRDGKKREIDWFESAGFRKEKDVWKIALYHNSVVEPIGN